VDLASTLPYASWRTQGKLYQQQQQQQQQYRHNFYYGIIFFIIIAIIIIMPPEVMLNYRPNGRRRPRRPWKRLTDEVETGLSKP
jgi:hypothetical protein